MNEFRILMVCAEYAPLAKAGGLADAAAGLSQALRQRGHDVRVVLPRYDRGDEEASADASGARVRPIKHPTTSVVGDATSSPATTASTAARRSCRVAAART